MSEDILDPGGIPLPKQVFDDNGLPIARLGDPSDTRQKVYHITVKYHEDLESLYNDMETEGGSFYIPDRAVDCVERREGERPTDYKLTYEEAVSILKDPRVLSVELTSNELETTKAEEHGVAITHSFDHYKNLTQYYANVATPSYALIYGRNKNNTQIDGYPWRDAALTTVTTDASGKNVDLVIAELAIGYPDAIEMAQNMDGTGYSRYVHYNWASYMTTGGTQLLSTPTPNSYLFDYNTWYEHGHAAGTASIAAGRLEGYAKDANVYGCRPLDSPSVWVETMVKNWHDNKPINPLTGVKNPTVMSQSWGYSDTIAVTRIQSITYRGVQYFPSSGSGSLNTAVWADADLISYKLNPRLINSVRSVSFGAPISAVWATITDCAKAGVILVGSAGNSSEYWDVPTGLDFNNSLIAFGTTYYYNRGGSPNTAFDAVYPQSDPRYVMYTPISVGLQDPSRSFAAGNLRQRASWSAGGPGVSIYAPGSSYFANYRTNDLPAWDTFDCDRLPILKLLADKPYRDDRDNNYYGPMSGTSMAAPNAAGVLACMLEKNPRWKQPDARTYVRKDCPQNMWTSIDGYPYKYDTGSDPASPIYSPDACNRSIYLPSTRNPEVTLGTSNVNGTYNPLTYSGYNHTSSRTVAQNMEGGFVYPRRNKLIPAALNPTFSISSSSYTVVNGDTANITVNTTGLPDGTKLRYIITARYQTTLSPRQTLGNVQITNTTGSFSCTATKINQYQPVKVSGTLATGAGIGSIAAYNNTPTTYYICSSNGLAANLSTTSFKLSTSWYNAHNNVTVSTTAGLTTGLTFTLPTLYDFKPASINYTPLVADLTIQNNTASFNIPITTTDKLYMYVRLDINPTPHILITVN